MQAIIGYDYLLELVVLLGVTVSKTKFWTVNITVDTLSIVLLNQAKRLVLLLELG